MSLSMSGILAAVTRQSCHPLRRGGLQVEKVGVQKEVRSSVLSMLRDSKTDGEWTVLYRSHSGGPWSGLGYNGSLGPVDGI